MSSSIINQILQKADIVEVVSEFINLSKVGKNFRGICTVHNDTSPSLSISEEKQFFKCFSCGVSGNVISFLEKFQEMSKKEAIVFLAKKYEINYNNFEYVENSRYNENQKKIIKAFDDISQKFSYDLSFKENRKALQFLKDRYLDSKIQNIFSIGYAKPTNLENYKDFLVKKNNNISTLINASLINENENPVISDRIVFPIKNEFGDIVALSARSLDHDEKNYKYINSAESIVFSKSTIIYNFWRAKEIAKELYLVEGFMDVIAFERVGLSNAVALMGTSISEAHVSKLKNHTITLFLDNDKAGINATIKSIYLLLKNKIDVNVIKNKTKYDPDEYLNKNGQENFLNLIKDKMAGIEFIFQYLINAIDLENSNNIKLFFNHFNKYLIYCDSHIKSQYVSKMAELLKIELEEINKIFNIKSTPKQQVNSQIIKNNVTNDQKDIKISNTYIFINRILLGMLENPKLIETYLARKVFLGTSEYMQLANYIINRNNNPNTLVDNNLEKILQEIQKTKNPPKTKNEFIETINNLEKYKMNIKLSQNKLKLDKIIKKNPDDEFILKIIQSSIKTKKQKEEK